MKIKKNVGFGGVVPAFLAFFCLVSCNSPSPFPATEVLGLQYFPLAVGNFSEYEVEEIVYELSEDPQTSRFQVREVVESQFINQSGDTVYQIERFRREFESDPWVLDSVWSARRDLNRAIRTENNLSFIKLTFPLDNGSTWDGNALNSLTTEDYLVQDFARPFSFDSTSFPNALRVEQNNNCNLVSLDRRVEVYAAEVGLIHSQTWQVSFDLNLCADTLQAYCDEQALLPLPELPPEICIQFGKIQTQKILNYGSQ